MFEAYSYKKKFLALLAVFVMLSITAYKRSFHTLFQVLEEYEVLAAKDQEFNAKKNNVDALQKEIAYLDQTIGKEGISKEEMQQGIVSFATGKNPQISISDLQPIHLFSEDNYTIITNQLDITGNVNQLLKVSYDFEKNFNLSRLVSMNFYRTKSTNKTEVLHLKMIFQNYENNN